MQTVFCILLITLAFFTSASYGHVDGHDYRKRKPNNQTHLIAEISAQLAKADVVRGEFVQKRFLKILSRPLISNGDFLYHRDLGVRWQVATPFPSVMYITQAGVSYQGERSQAVAESFGQLLLALLTVDMEQLNKHFQISAQLQSEKLQNEQWSLTLVPRSSQWQQALDKISVKGGQAVNSIEVFESGGDRVVVEIANIRHQPALSEQEQNELSNVLGKLRSGND